ncbi:MAG TPA: ABC transporter permease [Candidatus Nanopelagicales bacterium]|nr:ABC transporter permease [Candidatus Nanopelagicales bacterium]
MSHDQSPGARHSAATVRLVAGRELRTRLRSKAYRISTIALVVLVVAFALIAKAIGSSDSTVHIGVVGSEQGIAQSIQGAAAAIGQPVEVVSVPAESEGREQVLAGTLDALVVDGTGATLQVIVDTDLPDQLRGVLTAAAGQQALAEQITALGGDPAQVAEQVRKAEVEVTPLNTAPTYDPQRLVLGSAAGVLIYLALMFTGQMVAQGVVEEKSSRVVELLLAAVRPWELMAGKVLGIGLVGLLQVAIVGVAGVVAGRLSGGLTISLATTVSSVLWLVLWFVFGFVVFSLVFGGLASLVSRQEDVGSVIAPAMMFLIVGYVVGISVLPTDPGNPIVAVLSMVPFFSPTLMPMRLAMGGVPPWQIALSIVLVLVTIPALVVLAGRMYRNAVIRTGERVGLREALRG